MEQPTTIKSYANIEVTDDGETTLDIIELPGEFEIPSDAKRVSGKIYLNPGDNFNLYHDRDCRYFAKSNA